MKHLDLLLHHLHSIFSVYPVVDSDTCIKILNTWNNLFVNLFHAYWKLIKWISTSLHGFCFLFCSYHCGLISAYRTESPVDLSVWICSVGFQNCMSYPLTASILTRKAHILPSITPQLLASLGPFSLLLFCSVPFILSLGFPSSLIFSFQIFLFTSFSLSEKNLRTRLLCLLDHVILF